MLAQTQVDRVVPKFEAFVVEFPDFPSLARASPAAVLRQWKGLGYNRRAVNLQRLANAVMQRHDGVLPSTRQALRALPGVGPYTAAAIRAFAFNMDDAAVDTNVRRVVKRMCFGIDHPGAGVPTIERRANELVPAGLARDWNSALMDLGATICTARAPRCGVCPVRSHCVAAPMNPEKIPQAAGSGTRVRSTQSSLPFVKTNRYARGRIIDRLRDLPAGQRISLLDLHGILAPDIPQRSLAEVAAIIGRLESEGLVMRDDNGVALQE